MMSALKVFVTREGRATFVCPECERSRTVDVSRNAKLARASRVRVKCPCGHHYPVTLERRRFFRKTVHLSGSFFHMVNGRHVDRGRMAVLDLSRTGLRIRLNERRPLQVGDTLLVEFHLDDRQHSLIRRESVVRRIEGTDLGTEFAAPEATDANSRAIGFYLAG
jgi:hypothetical protein